jgi:hypothetical protein
MESFFSEIGIPVWDFVQVSATFILAMLIFFGVKSRRHLWLRYFMLAVFAAECLFVIGFHEGLRVKLFAALMLTSALVVIVATTQGNRAAQRRRTE